MAIGAMAMGAIMGAIIEGPGAGVPMAKGTAGPSAADTLPVEEAEVRSVATVVEAVAAPLLAPAAPAPPKR